MTDNTANEFRALSAEDRDNGPGKQLVDWCVEFHGRGGTQVDPHPVSGHRTPHELAQDAVGPIGQGDTDLVAKVGPGESRR
jgi:hypothetical protein